MQCPRCQHENAAEAKFCNQCGTPLAPRCSACGRENAADAKFCNQCGTPLTASAPVFSPTPPETPTITLQAPEPLSYTPPHLAEKILTSRRALAGERKHVTVLFADLKDSTELIKDLDPEAAQQLLDPAIHHMMDAVHRFEGTVNQVLGDGIMALFGAPIAHEDHALRACYAALAMQAAMRNYTDEVRRAHGIEMQMRVGLNSGEVVVRTIGNDLHMDYSAVGSTTHLAARMEQLATPGTIRLTPATLRLVEGLVRVNALGAIPVKGLPEPVQVFELLGSSAVRRRLQAAVARGLTRFVGRDAELTALHQALEQAGSGHGQVVATVGEAGVGKSRLTYEFIHSHRVQGWLLLESVSASYGKASPYFPLIDLLKRYCHIEDQDEPRTVRAKMTGQILTLDQALQDTLAALLSLLDVLPEDSPFLHLDPRQRRQQTLQALKRVLLRESQAQPLLLVVEDLHWIDAETQALLDSLVESLPTASVLLLVNYRPEYQHGWGSKTYYTQLRLDPLAPASAEDLLSALLGDDTGLTPLKRLLIERTGGNPFFLEESVRSLVETGVLEGGAGAYRLTTPVQDIAVPATVQAILAARIDRLEPEAKRLLQTAAVMGPEVTLSLLRAVTDLPEETLHPSLSHLQGAEFLYETRLYPDAAYTFKHALTQQVAYESLLLRTRQQVHGRIAQVLEAGFPESVETQPELLAQHYTQAGRIESALPYWQQAGDRAMQRSANTEAIRHLTTGLELLSTLPETPEHVRQELHLQAGLGATLMAVKGQAAPEVEQAYARALALCERVEETLQLFHVLRGLWNYYLVRRNMPTAYELSEKLLPLAERLQEPTLLAEAHWARGVTLYFSADLQQALSHLDQGLALYEAQPQHGPQALQNVGVGCYCYAAEVLWHLGYPDQALRRCEEGLALAHRLSHPYSIMWSQIRATSLSYYRREAQAAQAYAEACQARATEQGFAFWVAAATMERGWALAAQGQIAEGLAQLQQGMEAQKATGAPGPALWVFAQLAEAYGYGGQPEAGLAILDEGLTTARTGWCHYEAELHRLKGELILSVDYGWRMAEVSPEACFQKALDTARRQQARSLELRAAMSLSRLWQQQDKRQEARELLAEIYGWFTEGFDTADLQEAKTFLQELVSPGR